MFCQGNITVTEKKGLILGGKTVSSGTIRVNEAGSELNTRTDIYIGFWEKFMEELLKFKKEYSENYSKLNDVKKGLSKLEEIEMKRELCIKAKGIKTNLLKAKKDLSERMEELFEKINTMQKTIDASPDPKLTVLRKAYPGVIVNINNQQLTLQDIFINKTFRFFDDKIVADDATKF